MVGEGADGVSCPACNGKRSRQTETVGIRECVRCRAIFGMCYKGESYGLVLPVFSDLPSSPLDTRYYDLTVLGSAGIERRHGWFDTRNRKIVQTG